MCHACHCGCGLHWPAANTATVVTYSFMENLSRARPHAAVPESVRYVAWPPAWLAFHMRFVRSTGQADAASWLQMQEELKRAADMGMELFFSRRVHRAHRCSLGIDEAAMILHLPLTGLSSSGTPRYSVATQNGKHAPTLQKALRVGRESASNL
jgi:hypothetical protein